MPAPLLIVVGPTDDERVGALERTLQQEAGDALVVRRASSPAAALVLSRQAELAGVVCEQDAQAPLSALDVLKRVREETPRAKRFLVTRTEAHALARHPEFERVDAVIPEPARFADVSSGIVQETLDAFYARQLASFNR